MNLGQLKTRVKRQFGDESGVQVTDDDILSWTNEAIVNIVMDNDSLLQAVQTSNLVAGQSTYTPPTDLLNLRGLSIKTAVDTSYYPLKGLNLQDFNAHMERWDGDYYSPGFSYAFMFYNNTINIFPEPNTSQTDGIKIYYSRYPTKVAVDGDEITLPETYHNAVLGYCLQQAYELDENWEGSGNKALQVQTTISTLKNRQEWQTQDEYPTINVRPDDAW